MKNLPPWCRTRCQSGLVSEADRIFIGAVGGTMLGPGGHRIEGKRGAMDLRRGSADEPRGGVGWGGEEKK